MSLADNGIDMHLTDKDILRSLAMRWKDRREALEIKPGTVKHAEQQRSFFLGACHAMELCGRTFPRAALMMLSMNQDSAELWIERSK